LHIEPLLTDTDLDLVQDGTEGGLTAGLPGTSGAVFVPDADGGANTTDYLDPDVDGDGLKDGYVEDFSGSGIGAWPSDGAIAGDANNNTVIDGAEAWTETDPSNADSDTDGLLGDLVEYGLTGALGTWDTDSDGAIDAADCNSDDAAEWVPPGAALVDLSEWVTTLTDPYNEDTDNDGRIEETGVAAEESMLVDSDGDTHVDALDVDSDDDQIVDGDAVNGVGFGGTRIEEDLDHDGVADVSEPDALNVDSDFDTINDNIEFSISHQVWAATVAGFTMPDYSDGDGIMNPLDPDSDNDGVPDLNEYFAIPYATPHPTDPAYWDTDLDGRFDWTPLADNNETPLLDSDGDGVHNANDNDSDSDWLTDGYGEDFNFSGEISGDNGAGGGTADDGIINGTEVWTETSPINPNSDYNLETAATADTVYDGYNGWETITSNSDFAGGANAVDGDADGDGLEDNTEAFAFGYATSHPTDATMTDSDGDCRDEGTGDEDPMVDSDSDGAHNANDFDSDTDWFVDGNGSRYGLAYGYSPYSQLGEDNGGGAGLQCDGIVGGTETDPTVPNDQDGDGLPDWVEVSFGTQVNSTDSDGDNLDEGYSNVAAAVNYDFYGPSFFPNALVIGENGGLSPADDTLTTDPRYADSDQDGLDDGVEVNAGVNQDSCVTDPLDSDTDNDGLSDNTEDANADGEPNGDTNDDGIWGGGETWTESDPRDIDTDEDGLLDGFEVGWTNTSASGASAWDSDSDLLYDGLEFGIAARPTGAPAGSGGNINAGSPVTFAADSDPATYTDPDDSDTDMDGLGDGTEDADQSGSWDYTGNPYIPPGDPAGESNPGDPDSDHGDGYDGVDGQPMEPRVYDGGGSASIPNGDESFEIIPSAISGFDTTLAPSRDSLFIDPPPGDSGDAAFEIENNGAFNLDSLWVTVTDLDWAYNLPWYTAPPWADTLSIPADSVDIWGQDQGVLIFTNPVIEDLPVGDNDTLFFRVHIPWEQIPGYYEGRIVIWDGDPTYSNPIDTLVFTVEVEDVYELDICNNDDLFNGVGTSNQDSLGAADNEMHLVAPYGATVNDTTPAIFWLSNPNVIPDADADCINDVNGLPAHPQFVACGDPSVYYPFEWDTIDLYGNLDWQGNTDLYDVNVDFDFISAPAGIDSADMVSRIFFEYNGSQANHLVIDTFLLSTSTGLQMKIFTNHLPEGTYLGWVRVWEDDGNSVYDGAPTAPIPTTMGSYIIEGTGVNPGEQQTFDAFFFKMVIMTPDLDIADYEGDLSGNLMTMTLDPGDEGTGIFVMGNPADSLYNKDQYDGPGTEDADSVGLYDPDAGVLNTLPFTVLLHREDDPSDVIPAVIDGPDTLLLGEWSTEYSVRVTVPADAVYGVYTTDYTALNPVTTDPNDTFYGRLVMSCRGLYTNGKYEPIEPYSFQLIDWFRILVNVGAASDLDIVEASVAGSGPHGSIVTLDTVHVTNTGNATLHNVQMSADGDLVMDSTHSIPDENVFFTPSAFDTLAPDDTVSVVVMVTVDPGTYAGAYTGTLRAASDEGAGDVAFMTVTVLPSYDLDIDDNAQNLVANQMNLTGLAGDSSMGYFRLINPNTGDLNVDPDPFGNAPVTGLGVNLTDLVHLDGYTIPAEAISFPAAPNMLDAGEYADIATIVNIPEGQHDGSYMGTIEIICTEGPSDSFYIQVMVGVIEDLAVIGTLDDTVDHGGTASDMFTVTNVGNSELDNLIFEVTNLEDGLGNFIDDDNVSFIPTSIETLEVDESTDVTVNVFVELGTYAGTYSGIAAVKDDDGYPRETLPLNVTVLPSYDVDVDEAEVTLGAGDMGETLFGTFLVMNPNSEVTNVDPDPFGNADLSDLDWTATDLMYVGDAVARISDEIERIEDIERRAGGDISRVADEIARLMQIDTIITSDNVSADLPSFLASGDGFDTPIRVDIPMEVLAGTYYGWVFVDDGTAGVSDSFKLFVTVNAEADLDIVEDEVTDAVTHGELAQLDFTVENTGNTALNNVQFDAVNLEDGEGNIIPNYMVSFDPPVIAEIPFNDAADVTAVVDVPLGTYTGIYSGMAWATDGEISDSVVLSLEVTPTFDLDIAEVEVDLGLGYMGDELEGTFRLVNPNSAAMNVDPDPFGNADLIALEYGVTELVFVGDIVAARREAMRKLESISEAGYSSLMAIDSVIPAENVELLIPEFLASGWGDDYPVTVQLPSSDMLAGTYEGIVTVFDQQCGGVGDEFKLIVAIEVEAGIDIVESTIDDEVDHGEIAITTFTVENTGNADLENIGFEVTNLVNGTLIIPDYHVSFDPPSFDMLSVEGTEAVTVEVDVDPGTHEGTYVGEITATSDAVSDVVTIEVTVNPSYDLDIADNEANLVENTMTIVGAAGDTLDPSHFYLVNPNSEPLNKDPDAFGNASLTELDYVVSDMVTMDGYDMAAENIVLENLPSTLASGGSANVGVVITLPMDQHAGIYSGTVTVYSDEEVEDFFTLVVDVQETMELYFASDTVGFNGLAGDWADVDIDVINGGNATIWGMEVFAITDLVSGSFARIHRDEIMFTPPVLDTLAVADTAVVNMGVQIPERITRGRYYGSIEVRDDVGAPFDTLVVVLNVSSEEAVAFSDNPVVSDQVTIGYVGDPGYVPELNIANMAGELVLTEELAPIPATGADSYTWNLKNEAGKDVAPGLYIVVVQTSIDEEETVVRRKLLVIR
jgi:uncharacterized membrane protein